eukprot:1930923-Rhodomonas_salina.1
MLALAAALAGSLHSPAICDPTPFPFRNFAVAAAFGSGFMTSSARYPSLALKSLRTFSLSGSQALPLSYVAPDTRLVVVFVVAKVVEASGAGGEGVRDGRSGDVEDKDNMKANGHDRRMR